MLNDASLKSIIIQFNNLTEDYTFTKGIPISGVHIESDITGATGYYRDFVEIWKNNNGIYSIRIIAFSTIDGSMAYSNCTAAIIYYI